MKGRAGSKHTGHQIGELEPSTAVQAVVVILPLLQSIVAGVLVGFQTTWLWGLFGGIGMYIVVAVALGIALNRARGEARALKLREVFLALILGSAIGGAGLVLFVQRQSFVQFAVWASLIYAVFVVTIALLEAHRQIFHSRRSAMYPELFSVRLPSKIQRRCWLSGAPDMMSSGLCWPATFPWFLVVLIQVKFNNWRLPVDEVYRQTFQEFRKQKLGALWFLLWGLFPLILVYLFSKHSDTSLPVIIWVFLIWLSFLLWILATYVPGNSLHNRIKAYPEKRILDFAIMAITFGVLLPVVTSALYLSITAKEINATSITHYVTNTYTLRGIVWHGPKSTLALLRKSPYDILFVMTGILLYAGIVKRLRDVLPSIAKPPTDQDLEFAARVQLIAGDHHFAAQLLERMSVDSDSGFYLKIIVLIRDGELSKAKGLVRERYPFLGSFASSRDVATLGLMLFQVPPWKLDNHVRDWIISELLAANPSEEDLIVLYVGFVHTQLGNHLSQAWRLYAIDKHFNSFLFLISSITRDATWFQESGETVFRVCSLSGAAQMLTNVLIWKAAVEINGRLKEILPGNMPIEMSLATESAKRVPGLMLIYLSSTLARSFFTFGSEEQVERFLEIEQRILEKLASMPFGAAISDYLLQLAQALAASFQKSSKQSGKDSSSRLEHVNFQGKQRLAKVLGRGMLHLAEANCKPGHPSIAVCQLLLSTVLRQLGEFEEARRLLTEALASAEANYGADHPETATYQVHLGTLLYELGELEAARGLLNKALTEVKSCDQVGRTEIATNQSSLGLVLMELGELKQARHLLEKALEKAKESYGSDHPGTRRCQANLARLLRELGEAEDARRLLDKSLTGAQDGYQRGHPEFFSTQSSLGQVLMDLGQFVGLHFVLWSEFQAVLTFAG